MPDAITTPALIAGAWRVSQANRPVFEIRLKPVTTMIPIPTSAMASPRLKPKTVKTPNAALPVESASNITSY